MVRRIPSLQASSRHRRYRNVPHRYQLVFIFAFLVLQFFSYEVLAQDDIPAQLPFAVGLYEGLMGNSGVALSDPTAASYYNPSLLNRKKKDSYSISGNTFGTFSSASEEAKTTSLALNPGYLATVLVGDALVHEFFIVNISPSKLNVAKSFQDSELISRSEFKADRTQFLFGYSMAFRSIPFALSYFGQYNQTEMTGFSEYTSLISNMRSTQYTKLDLKYLGLGISVSGYAATQRGYTLGYQFKTRQLIVYKKDVTNNSSFVHGGASAADYNRYDSTYENESEVRNGSQFAIGHGFVNGDHEFITDSHFQERSNLNYSFTMTQTFGYRLNSRAGNQFLVGFAHQIGSEVKYLGQSAYYSVGMSWLKNSLRSTFGAYALSSRIGQDVFAAGLTFGSEFSY